jgi:lipoic acid synthetase
MGETDDELRECMVDLRAAGVDTLTIGQYLQPSAQHLALDRYVSPDVFAELRRFGEEELGFAHVEAGPLVRSSYHAGQQAIDAKAWAPSAGQPGGPTAAAASA